jgi:hypothetical protein
MLFMQAGFIRKYIMFLFALIVFLITIGNKFDSLAQAESAYTLSGHVSVSTGQLASNVNVFANAIDGPSSDAANGNYSLSLLPGTY